MAKAPRVTGTEAIRALKSAGWQVTRQAGSHIHLKHAEKAGRVTIPTHAGEILKPKTLASILEQAGLTVEEFRKLL
jgi:predicted RNA binding protein YcfA (HicA-like mRNA interferase family)